MGANTQLYYGMAQDPLDQLSGGGFHRATSATTKLGRYPVLPAMMSDESRYEEVLRQVAEQVAETALSPDDRAGGDNSPARPEWQKLCIQHSVCIHNIYGNCAYAGNCYYHHLEEFKKPDLLYKTEMCRYGSDCVNRPRCCFAHSKKERRTPEQNVREALAKNHIHCFNTGPNANNPNGASATAGSTATSSGMATSTPSSSSAPTTTTASPARVTRHAPASVALDSTLPSVAHATPVAGFHGLQVGAAFAPTTSPLPQTSSGLGGLSHSNHMLMPLHHLPGGLGHPGNDAF